MENEGLQTPENAAPKGGSLRSYSRSAAPRPIRQEELYVEGARVHNLKNISLAIPHHALTVVTGLSGSGKSSLVFDVIYAEGQRRFMETLSAYSRQFLGGLERPDVDYISGLGPVIAIEQRTTGKNSRSTVGTITEVYDFLRLLYSRVAQAHSPVTGKLLLRFSEEEIADYILREYDGQKVAICAPLVKGRRGSYEALFAQMAKRGFLYARIDGKITELTKGLIIDRYAVHDIELIIDRLPIDAEAQKRLPKAIKEALRQGNGTVGIAPLEGTSMRLFSTTLMCPESGFSLAPPEPHTFSFNSPYGRCPHCLGLGVSEGIKPDLIIANPKKPLLKGGLAKVTSKSIYTEMVHSAIKHWLKKKKLGVDTAFQDLPQDSGNNLQHEFLWGEPSSVNIDPFDQLIGHSTHSFCGIIALYNVIVYGLNDDELPEKVLEMIGSHTCPDCNGKRLNTEALCFRIEDKDISDAANMSLSQFAEWIENLEDRMEGKNKRVAHEILKEIRARVDFILGVGLGYLSLNRPSDTLSGGESQRIRLATQIGTELVNVLYILDEPSIGLHPRDNTNLILAMKRLRDQGNTVLVVEHDEEMIRAADHIVDLGPGAGRHGGEIVGLGNIKSIQKENSLSGDYLSGRRVIEIPATRREGNGKSITLEGATGNNLKNVTCSFPLGCFICITGVAGSGKSTLLNDTLFPILSKELHRSQLTPLPYKNLLGIENVDKVIRVDQSPLGRTPRSNPATYTGIFTDIRKLFAATPEARMRGYEVGRFSFNVKGGRCERCKGAGYEVFEMNFLPDVHALCSECGGKRYNRETLAIRYKGKNIAEVLDMTISEAVEFFEAVPTLKRKIETLNSVGMGYVKLGQSSTTLSGGESQRIRLSSELSRKATGNTLYILDEPTTGLHFEDIRLLINVLQSLVDKGNTVIVIEHNLDVVKCADWVIDMGPESGQAGGEIIVTGTPEQVAASGKGHTSAYLAETLSMEHLYR